MEEISANVDVGDKALEDILGWLQATSCAEFDSETNQWKWRSGMRDLTPDEWNKIETAISDERSEKQTLVLAVVVAFAIGGLLGAGTGIGFLAGVGIAGAVVVTFVALAASQSNR